MNKAQGPASSAPMASVITERGIYAWRIHVAQGFFSRLRGLMFRRAMAQDEGLILLHCASVHTAFMRFAIDVVYLDGRGMVIKCVSRLEPWRASSCVRPLAAHTLELPVGSIDRLGIEVGDCCLHPRLLLRSRSAVRSDRPGLSKPRIEGYLLSRSLGRSASAANADFTQTVPMDHSTGLAQRATQRGLKKFLARRQIGASMVEFAVAAPLITFLGMAILQYGMLFNAKNMLNHAAFMAAREGSVQHANLSAVRNAYTQALIPLYGGGKTAAEMAKSLARAQMDVSEHVRVEMDNPSKEDFDAYNSKALQAKYKTGAKRVISNAQLASIEPLVDKKSGQTIQDANVLKLRFTHGYRPQVPFVASVYVTYLKWLDDEKDPVKTQMIDDGRIPIETYATVQMQSDPIEPASPVSNPGVGNDGKPTDPGPAPVPDAPPPDWSTDPKPPGDGTTGATSTGCDGAKPVYTDAIQAEVLFEFDKSVLKPEAKTALDKWIAQIKDSGATSVELKGYTDPLGSKAYNLKLSQDRADAVKAYMVSQGLSASMITAVGAGTSDKVSLSQCADQPSLGAKQACLKDDRYVSIQFE